MLSRKLHEDTWYKRKELLDDAEEERRRQLMEEEKKLVEQRKSLAAMKRELRIRELRLLDSSRMRFVDHQQSVRQMELNRLDEEIKRKAFLRNEERMATVENVEIKGLELEAQRAALEQQMARQQVELEAKLREDIQRRRKMEDVENNMAEKVERQHDVDLNKLKDQEWNLASTELKANAVSHQIDAMSKLLYSDIDREKDLAKSLSRNINNLKQNADMSDQLKEARNEKLKELDDANERLRCLEEMRSDCDERRINMIKDRNLDECRRRVRESEMKLQDHIDRMNNGGNNGTDESNDDRGIAMSNDGYMEEITQSTQDSSTWSYDRNRLNFPDGEQQLMDQVRQLRQRFVNEGRATSR